VGIEVAPAAVHDERVGVGHRPRGTAVSFRDECIEYIHDRGDPGELVDARTDLAIGVAVG
jgi:hypothetical protein